MGKNDDCQVLFSELLSNIVKADSLIAMFEAVVVSVLTILVACTLLRFLMDLLRILVCSGTPKLINLGSLMNLEYNLFNWDLWFAVKPVILFAEI